MNIRDAPSKSESTLKRLRQELAEIEVRRPEPPLGQDLGPSRHWFATIAPDLVTAEGIAAIVERMTRVPVQQLLATDRDRLLKLDESLAKQVSSIYSL